MSGGGPSQEKLLWLAPVKGLFVPVQERYPQEHPQGRLFDPIRLEEGVEWHLSPTDMDRAHMEEWFNFWEEYIAKSERGNLAGADTLLVGAPLPADDGMPPFVACFVVAASLHVNAHIRSQMLRFHEVEGHVRPHSGYPLHHATALERWPEQQPVDEGTREAVAETYRVVRRCFDHEEEHAFRRTVSAYRAATGGTFVDGTAILLCASLEALAASYHSHVVIRRLVPRYLTTTPEREGRRRLKRLYLLRHWFAHSARIADMRERAERQVALDEGYALTKDILRNALADEELEAAVAKGTREVGEYLGMAGR